MSILRLILPFLAVLTSSAQAGGRTYQGRARPGSASANQPVAGPPAPTAGPRLRLARTPAAPRQTDPDPDTSGVPTRTAEKPAWGYNPSRTPSLINQKFPEFFLSLFSQPISIPNTFSCQSTILFRFSIKFLINQHHFNHKSLTTYTHSPSKHIFSEFEVLGVLRGICEFGLGKSLGRFGLVISAQCCILHFEFVQGNLSVTGTPPVRRNAPTNQSIIF